MNLKSKFVQTLIALASAVPVSAATAGVATAASRGSEAPSEVDFASNLPTKLIGMASSGVIKFPEAWTRTDFVQVQTRLGEAPSVAVSAMEAFELANRT